QMADRLEARERIVIDLAKVRIDDEGVAVDNERIAVGLGTRRRLIGDRGAAARAILDDDGRPVGLADLIAKEPGKNVGAAARWERNHDPDRSRRLGGSAVA